MDIGMRVTELAGCLNFRHMGGYRTDDGRITINRPKQLNALNAAVFTEMQQVLFDLIDPDATRVIVIQGAGERAFAAGIHDLDGLVNYLNTTGPAGPNGERWTADSYQREMARLGA